MCRSLFFDKVAGLNPETLLTNRLIHRCFSVSFAKFFRTPFFTEYLGWLHLSQDSIKGRIAPQFCKRSSSHIMLHMQKSTHQITLQKIDEICKANKREKYIFY